MSDLILTCNPIAIIISATEVKDGGLLHKFAKQIEHLYQYEIFKPLLDLAASKIKNRQLKFVVQDSRFFDLDEGNCKTIISNLGTFGGFLNKIHLKKQYIITIKKIASDVIIHEISHMLEQEIAKNLNMNDFIQSIKHDISLQSTANPSLSQAIDHIMVQQVLSYPDNQHKSELFARFFQIFAAAKETAFATSESYSYNITQASAFFYHTIHYFNQNLTNHVLGALDEEITRASQRYLKKIDDIKEKWADRKTKSMHSDRSAKNKWSNTVKSIKDDPLC